MNFELKLILQNLLALAIIWAVLLTQPLLGYAFIAAAAVYAWTHRRRSRFADVDICSGVPNRYRLRHDRHDHTQR